MIYARCTVCGQTWNVAIGQQFPKGGYICPYCEAKQRKEVNPHGTDRNHRRRPRRLGDPPEVG